MDWSRAKTILIISFTLLNALLGYQLWGAWHEQTRANVVSSQTVEELNQLLTAEQIDLADTLPMELQKMGYVQVNITRMDEEWQPLWPRVEIQRDEGGREEVTEKLRPQIAQLSHYVLDENALQDKQWIYYQLIGDFPVYVAPTEVRQEGNSLTAYRQVSVKVTAKERTNTVVPAHAALKTAVEAQLIPPGSTVEEVRLGYTGQLKAQEPQFLVPVWRIKTNGMSPLFVNALTGGIEADNWPLD